ncbi:GntR family transcriptional regulator [Amycolatopsis nivea]
MATNTAGMAPFERIAEDLRQRIRSGALQKGDKLPSYRDLANTHNVAPMTAQKAVQLLVSEGLAVSRSPLGSFVSESWETAKAPMTVEQLASELATLRERVERLEGRLP